MNQTVNILSVWDCGSGGGLKCFSFRNVSKWSFFIFKKIFLTSAHQNDLKTKKIYFKQKKISKFLKMLFTPCFQTPDKL
jgi:hypothetical protein